MNDRYSFYQFDPNTYVVIDNITKREICVCNNFDEECDALSRATKLVALLNLDYSTNTK